MESTSTNNLAQYNQKIKLLLGKFLEPDFHIQNDIYLNRLLAHLSGKETADFGETAVIDLPIFTEWLIEVVTLWETNNYNPTINIQTFIINLASLLTKNELKFIYLNNNSFYIKLVNKITQHTNNIPPIIIINYIKLLNAILEHNSGIEWMINYHNYYWENILNFTIKNHTIYITKEGQQFVCKLLEKTIDKDPEFCTNIIKTIMLPLINNNLNGGDDNTVMVINDEVMYGKLSTTLQLIGNILEYLLESALFTQKNFRIVLMFLKDYNLEQHIYNCMLLARHKSLVFDLGKIMFIIQYLELYINVVRNTLKPLDLQQTERKLMYIFNTNITYGNYENIIKYCHLGQYYWNTIGYKIPSKYFNKDNEPIAFPNQLVVLQTLPIFCISYKYCFDQSLNEFETHSDELQDAFCDKVFKFMCENTLRIAFNWKHWLLDQTNLFDISTLSLIYVMKSRKYYPRERAAIVFQTLMYSLRDIVATIKDNPQKLLVFQSQTTLISAIFEALSTFIEEFNITWRESIETICVLGISFDFLTIPTWPTTLVVKALKLVQISIVKYMPPNLALLIDNTTDSTMALMGPLLYAKLHDGTWEVRDSALEVVCTISQLSNTKFPSLQKVLLDSDLPDLILKMATNDGESFVRASAIKCLQEMIKIDDIWNNALISQDLPKKMRQILLNETEGIVRVEATTFLCVYYEYREFLNDTINDIYDTMIHASTIDLHWEVKVRGLSFWELVMKKHLHNQGVIDGRFPDVTFSKEHRKIVALTHNEVRKRLQKVLQQLSQIGCLSVLLQAINDDCDIEVTKEAVKIAQKFIDFLKIHNITQTELNIPISSSPSSLSENGVPTPSSSSGVSLSFDDYQNHLTPASTMSPIAATATTRTMMDSDEIIEQILNTKDINLLNHVYTPNSDFDTIDNYDDLNVRKIIEPNEFLLFIKQDLNNIIDVKKNWLNGIEDLNSLLDDMLKTYNNDDINTMDCY